MQATSHKPLSGLRILVTRPVEQAETLAEKLRGLGATVIELPTIQIVPAGNPADLDRALNSVEEYEWLIFTSVYGVRFVTKRMVELGIPIRLLDKVKVAAIGPATAAEVETVGKVSDYVPSEFLSEKIVDGLGDVKGKLILLPRADIASKRLPALLRERGALVDNIVAYRTVRPAKLTVDRVKSILADGVDIITFTSPSTVRNLAQVVGESVFRESLGHVKVACIGPVTVQEAQSFGLGVDMVARSHTTDGLIEEILNETRNI